jgi:hypothetical protein
MFLEENKAMRTFLKIFYMLFISLDSNFYNKLIIHNL